MLLVHDTRYTGIHVDTKGDGRKEGRFGRRACLSFKERSFVCVIHLLGRRF